jgi:hypothetical protein
LAFHSGREADHSPPSSAEVKECLELFLHSPNTPSWRGAQLGEHRDNFTFIIKSYGVCYVYCIVLKNMDTQNKVHCLHLLAQFS